MELITLLQSSNGRTEGKGTSYIQEGELISCPNYPEICFKLDNFRTGLALLFEITIQLSFLEFPA